MGPNTSPSPSENPSPAPPIDSVVHNPLPPIPGTPLSWRIAIGASIFTLALLAYAMQSIIGVRGQAAVGILFFFGLVAMFSSNLRAVNKKTILGGVALQLCLALLVIHGRFSYNTIDPVTQESRTVEWSVHDGIKWFAGIVDTFIGYANEGGKFVFGNLAKPSDMATVFGDNFAFPFAFIVLPTILFVSAFFTVLYHFGILQICVRGMSKVMIYVMGTSGAETLSVSANVFMGQTEAPLIVKPYVPRMTNSELFALMTSGMAHISGGMMAVYISYGADPVAVLTTCVMACPCSLYLAKLFMPEVSVPETSGSIKMNTEKSPYVNAVDAAASGTSDGLRLALNVAAMLIVFIAFTALIDGLLSVIQTQWITRTFGWAMPDKISLQWIFGKLFSPIAFLMGVESADQDKVGSLLGTKLVINEHFAYIQLKGMKAIAGSMSDRSYQLAAFALTGFANFSSVGIQLGGIGALAPGRRNDLARLGLKALFVGYTATLLNAAIAGVLLGT
ncbi:MAG: nucleoside transporter C-terminal domain-containing protein [Pirellulales bacterium]